MSHPRRNGNPPGKALIDLAKRQSELAIDLYALLAGATVRPWADLLVLQCRKLASAIEEAGVDVQLGRRDLGPDGPDLPVLAAIEKKSHQPAKDGSDWRSSRVDGLETRLMRLCRDSGIETAGQAWDQLEAGALSPHFWTHAEARELERAVAQMRVDAGDPAPYLEAMENRAHGESHHGEGRVREIRRGVGGHDPAGADRPREYPARDGGPGPEAAPVRTPPPGRPEGLDRPGHRRDGPADRLGRRLPRDADSRRGAHAETVVPAGDVSARPGASPRPVREPVIVGVRAGAEAAREPEGPDGRARYVALNVFGRPRYVARAYSLEAARLAIGRLDIAGALQVVEDLDGIGADQSLTAVPVTEEDERQARAIDEPLTPEELDDFATEEEFAAAVELADLDAPGGPDWRPDRPALSEEPSADSAAQFPAHVIPPDFDFCSLHPPKKPKPETPVKIIDVCNLPRPKRVRKSRAKPKPEPAGPPPGGGEPRVSGKTLGEQGYAPGVGPVESSESWRSASIVSLDLDDKLKDILIPKYRDVGELADMLDEQREHDRKPDLGIGFTAIGVEMRKKCRAAVAKLTDGRPADGSRFLVKSAKGHPLYLLTADSIEQATAYVREKHDSDDQVVDPVREGIVLPRWLTTRGVPAHWKPGVDLGVPPKRRSAR